VLIVPDMACYYSRHGWHPSTLYAVPAEPLLTQMSLNGFATDRMNGLAFVSLILNRPYQSKTREIITVSGFQVKAGR
jgi:hypothetical protein